MLVRNGTVKLTRPLTTITRYQAGETVLKDGDPAETGEGGKLLDVDLVDPAGLGLVTASYSSLGRKSHRRVVCAVTAKCASQ